jgi:hypothetical protein
MAVEVQNPRVSGSCAAVLPTWDQVPGVPGVVQTQMDPVWSMTKSPAA